jgi:hypothetical protein
MAGHRLRTGEAAAFLRLSPSTLAKMRVRGNGPMFEKAGARIVVYDEHTLEAWLASRKRRSTSDSAEPGQ